MLKFVFIRDFKYLQTRKAEAIIVIDQLDIWEPATMLDMENDILDSEDEAKAEEESDQ